MDTTALEEKIMEILTEVNDEIAGFEGDNLFEAGLLDSFQVIDVVAELEDAFDIEIDAAYVVEENFATKDAIVTLMRQLTGISA